MAWRVIPLFAVLGAAAVASRYLRRRFVRYEVAGGSMAPAFTAGDFLLVDMRAFARRQPCTGELILAPDPRQPARMLLKRVAEAVPGGLLLLGDNSAASTDSRHFGPVAVEAVLGRPVLRYWPPRSFAWFRPPPRR